MNKHTDGDPLAELAALRQRLSNLEAEHRELKRQATRTRRPAFSRKFLLCALPVALVLATAGLLYAVDALFIDGTGNVGIGTTTPAAKLDVAGTVRLGRGIADSWFPYTDNNAYISGAQTIIRGGKSVEASRNYAEFVRIDQDGNVGIGKTNPGTKLDVNGTLNVTGNSTLNKDTTINGGLTVTGNGNSSFTGNVGIGTTSPAPGAKLDVAGNLKVAGDALVTGTLAAAQIVPNWVSGWTPDESKTNHVVEFNHNRGYLPAVVMLYFSPDPPKKGDPPGVVKKIYPVAGLLNNTTYINGNPTAVEVTTSKVVLHILGGPGFYLLNLHDSTLNPPNYVHYDHGYWRVVLFGTQPL